MFHFIRGKRVVVNLLQVPLDPQEVSHGWRPWHSRIDSFYTVA